MKNRFILTILLLTVLSLIQVIADDESVSWEGYDQSMTDEDFQNLFEEDPVGAFSVDPTRAWQTVETNPYLMEDPDILDSTFNQDPIKAANMINKEPSLMDNSDIANRFDQEAQRNVHVLNDNPMAKKKWFSFKGITDEGAEVESYDGTIVKTKGSESTTFNINDHPGARVLSSGKLILSNGAEISSAEVTKAEDGRIDVEGGDIDLTNTHNANVRVIDGAVHIDNKIYTNPFDTLYISINNEETVIRGHGVFEFDSDLGEITSEYYGTISFYKDGHKKIHGSTAFHTYRDGERFKLYRTTQDTLYYNQEGECDGSVNCIEDYPNPQDELVLLYQRLKTESEQEGFNLNEFIQEEFDNFKVDSFTLDYDSPYAELYVEILEFQQHLQNDMFNLDEHISEKFMEVGNKHGTIQSIQEDPVFRFYQHLQSYSNREDGFNINEYTNSELRRLMVNEFVERPEHENIRTYKFLNDIKDESENWGEGYNIQDYFLENDEPTPKDNVRIVAVNDGGDYNSIDLEVYDSSINELKVDQIDDISEVSFRERDFSIRFSKNEIKSWGNPDTLSTDIVGAYIDFEDRQHDFRMEDGVISECSPCPELGDFYLQAQRVIVNSNKLSPDKIQELKEELQERWGARPRTYMGIFNEEAEKDIISMLYSVADTASQNNYGITVTPEEIAITFLSEGGILLFSDIIYDIPISQDSDGVVYKGETYNVLLSAGGQPHINAMVYTREYSMQIPLDQERVEAPYGGVYFDVEIEIDENGNERAYYKDEFQGNVVKVYSMGIPQDATEATGLDGKVYEVEEFAGFSSINVPMMTTTNDMEIPLDQDFVISDGETYDVKTEIDPNGNEIAYYEKEFGDDIFKYYDMQIPKGTTEIEVDGKIYPTKESRFGLVSAEILRTTIIVSLPVPDVDEYYFDGKQRGVRENADGKRFIYGDGPYYRDHMAPVSGAGVLGLDVIGMRSQEGETEFDRLKRLGYIPEEVEMTYTGDTTIDGYPAASGDFDTLLDGMTTLAGVYAERKQRFETDYKNLEEQGIMDVPFEDLSDSDKYYWTTVYYNAAGPRSKLIEQRGVVQTSQESDIDYSHDYVLNAARRTGSYELLVEAGIFN